MRRQEVVCVHWPACYLANQCVEGWIDRGEGRSSPAPCLIGYRCSSATRTDNQTPTQTTQESGKPKSKMAAPDRREERRRPWPPAAADADAAAGGSTIPGSEEEGSSRLRLQDRLTVIVTTRCVHTTFDQRVKPSTHQQDHPSINSPVRSNPDTTIIRRVLSSFGIVPGLDACRKIIVCDGFQVAGPGAAPKYVVGVFVVAVVDALESCGLWLGLARADFPFHNHHPSSPKVQKRQDRLGGSGGLRGVHPEPKGPGGGKRGPRLCVHGGL